MPRFHTPDGTGLFYADEGVGLPLICLSGLTRNHRDFDHLAPHLAGVRLIRPDYRGRGLSDWPGPAGYTVLQEAQDVLALMDHLGLERAAVLGTSRGGLIAMVMGGLAHARLLGICFNDIGPEIAPRGAEIIRSYLGRLPAHKTLVEAAEARARHWTSFTGVPMERWLAEVANHDEETAEGLTLRYDPRLREAVLSDDSAPRVDLWPLFDGLAGLPLALIRGKGSDILSRATADEMSRRRPDMIRTDIAGRGHVPFLDEPQALAAIHDWLELMQ